MTAAVSRAARPLPCSTCAAVKTAGSRCLWTENRSAAGRAKRAPTAPGPCTNPAKPGASRPARVKRPGSLFLQTCASDWTAVQCPYRTAVQCPGRIIRRHPPQVRGDPAQGRCGTVLVQAEKQRRKDGPCGSWTVTPAVSRTGRPALYIFKKVAEISLFD
jgi:uncharacterized low-complexity protein